MVAKIWIRRLRLFTGMVLLVFVTGHLVNLALGLRSLDTIEAWHSFFMDMWQTRTGEALLAGSLLVHVVLGLQSIAARRTFAMTPTDSVQLVLALLVPPLLVAHVVTLRLAGEMTSDFNGTYGFILAVYWSYAPLLAFQQLAGLICVWTHSAIGFYNFMVLQPVWSRIGGFVMPILFAVPILSLLGFAQSGKETLDRMARDEPWRHEIEVSWAKAAEVADRLMTIQNWVLGLYFAAAAVAIGIFVVRLMIRRRRTVKVSYDGGAVARGARGLSILELSRANDIPHASICSGRGRCGTCRVEIVAGVEKLSPIGPIETRTLGHVHAGPGVRLACQAQVMGDGVSVIRVLPPFADASAARSPQDWVPEPGASEAPEMVAVGAVAPALGPGKHHGDGEPPSRTTAAGGDLAGEGA